MEKAILSGDIQAVKNVIGDCEVMEDGSVAHQNGPPKFLCMCLWKSMTEEVAKYMVGTKAKFDLFTCGDDCSFEAKDLNNGLWERMKGFYAKVQQDQTEDYVWMNGLE